MSFFSGSSDFTINGGTFTSISVPTQDAGKFLFPSQALLLKYRSQPPQHKYWEKEVNVIVVNLMIVLRLMTFRRGVGVGVLEL